MEKLFNNILFPVHGDSQSDLLLEKAVIFANQLQCNLHLVHFQSHSRLEKWMNKIRNVLGIRVTQAAIRQKLATLKHTLSGRLNDGLLLVIAAEKGEAREKIQQYIEANDIDMVLVNDRLQWLPVSAIHPVEENESLHAQYAVLTFDSGFELGEIKTIILAVGRNLALNKLRVAAYLAKQFGAAIHLLAIEINEAQKDELPYMKKAFRILKDNTQIPVVCKRVNGHDAGIALMQYGKKVDAGLVITNPQTMNFWKKLKRKIFAKSSAKNPALPVLVVD